MPDQVTIIIMCIYHMMLRLGPESDIMTCIKIDKPLEVCIFCNVTVIRP